MRTYNILFFIGKYPNFGGAERITTILANSFVAQGNEVTIVSCKSCAPLDSMGLDERVNLSVLPYPHPFPTQNNIEFLRQYIHKYHIDVIVNQWCLPFYITYLFNKARTGTNCRLLSVLHSIPNRSKTLLSAELYIKDTKNVFSLLFAWSYRQLVDRVMRRSMHWVYYHSDAYVVLSKRFIPLMEEYAHIQDKAKLVVIANPITIPTAYQDDSYLYNKSKQILYVGRIAREDKRVDRVIKVWEHLSSKFPDWNLLLVGDGPYKQELESYVRENKVERVHFAGFVGANSIDHFKQSSILLLTSDIEGFGLVIVEAMSYGVVPVVYGSYDAVFDIIIPDQDGFIVQTPFNYDEMESKVSLLIENEEKRIGLSIHARETSKRFQLSSVLKQWNELFDYVSN